MTDIENRTSVISNDLFGRLDIYASSDEITPENVITELNTALPYHVQNLLQEDYLYWYRRNVQPILNRTKKVRPEIMNVVQENHADEIVTFKNGFMLQRACFYCTRKGSSQRKVDKLNEYLYLSGKQDADNAIVNWFHTVGKGVLYVEPDRTNDPETPVHAYALDPRSAVVVYSMKPGNEPVMGVNMVVVDDVAKFDVFTKDRVYHLTGGATGRMMTTQVNSDFLATAVSIDSVEPNVLGLIPIIEYRYNEVNMGAFEAVIPLLDAINVVMSNRIDGIEQFIQSLAVATNCEFPEGTTANDIQRAGMIILKSIGENRADFKILSEQLNQSETQVLVDHLYEQVLKICSMPSTMKGGRSTSDTGAAVLARDGWHQASCSTRGTEDLFKKSNRQFDAILCKILKQRGLLEVKQSDFELHFDHGETVNVQAKAQSFHTLLGAGLHPVLAAEKSGVSNDPVADIKMSEKYLKMIWGDPDHPELTEDNNTPPVGAGYSDGSADNSQKTVYEDDDGKLRDPQRDAQDRKNKENEREQGTAWVSGYWQKRGKRNG